MTKDEAAVHRISTAAFSDEGYRVQLLNLADSHGGIYRLALDALYAIERERLGEEQALALVARDSELVRATHEEKERRERLAAIGAAGALVAAAENTARAVRAHECSKLVRAALADEVCRQRLEALAKKRVKRNVYAEALAELKDHP